MKKLMTLMLGLSFLVGTATLFAADDTKDAPKTEKKAKKKGKKSKDAKPADEKKS
jgi:hypothetical protein